MRMLSLCGMKTQQMYTARNWDWPSWALTAVALLGLMGLAYGQGDQLSTLTPLPARSTAAEVRKRAPELAPTKVPVQITDDGRQGDERSATAQLIFAFTSEDAHSITVDVLDESGRVVSQRTLTAKPGRNALAMDVSDLREGRYAARITQGDGGRVVRFHR